MQRNDLLIPSWPGDQLDSPEPPAPEPPSFDAALGAWVLSRHEDVLAAFRSSALAPAGPHTKRPRTAEDQSARRPMRAETLEALSPAQLRDWSAQLTPSIATRISSLPEDAPVDLVADYLSPLCLELAVLVTGIDPIHAAHYARIAEPISASAAEPYDLALRDSAKTATAQLQGCFHSRTETLRDSGFVALAYTLPCLIANAWYALFLRPEQWTLLHTQPDLTDQAIEELLRFAGLTRILFRQATQDLAIGPATIRQGDRIILRLIAANRDPARFPNAKTLDITSREPGQLSLGAGAHACVGASLIRMAAILLTRPLAQAFQQITLGQTVEWQGGSGFRSPRHLPVRLVRKP
ncbi:cytochrome P450 [Granulicella tundricola]|uniref:Cytochrome P450-like protein n=1 Tax=Granulicella tundricola (strain ATCC BAA-1859 / DSM 23138 / MP5ACTX9) TaxID=1198114 RepID=E8WXA7_GRATM|nr:cytochrome P450 [Granulicella tundricola]ADW67440.1 cytochrome P450-like protein [Granulicella tundricola MP5ACTX9]